ncbi:MAG: DEAD/DEAH box helicase [Verrucomicrobiota bacterium]
MKIPDSVLNQLVIPDDWQAKAVQCLKDGSDVILDAPTGAGKTFVLEQYLDSARPAGSGKILYTAPTRALANDKYFEWLERKWRVGLCTGDVRLHLDAPVLVGTLEALRSRLSASQEDESLPSMVVIDEYQWLSDEHRGNHYEGVIMNCPPETQILLMSGSVRNVEEVTQWFQTLGRSPIAIRHFERPVPLEEMDAGHLQRKAPKSVEGFWIRALAGALADDLGPILVFAPHRKEAEKIARAAASRLPNPDPLQLTDEQSQIAGKTLSTLLEKRIAFHHSGLSWQQRAGLIEPLAKSGQLRVVVSTLGLSSGINFSLRSVMVTARGYTAGGIEHRLQPDDVLQMAGRAGRRGKDSMGYYLYGDPSPRLGDAHQVKIKRSSALPWHVLLQQISEGGDTRQSAVQFAHSLFLDQAASLQVGCESDPAIQPDDLPCQRLLDTSRARLVRNTRRPFKACKNCPRREDCLAFDLSPTLLWQWQRIGLLDQRLLITDRGKIVSQFLGPEGLALAAALEAKNYPAEELVSDLADCFAGERFNDTEPRWSGRLAMTCQKAYGRFSIEGYLTFGVPGTYGIGGSQVVRDYLSGAQRKARLGGEFASTGDVDRLLTEWTSFLRQITSATVATELRREEYRLTGKLWDRFAALQEEAKAILRQFPESELPKIPPLTGAQRKPVSHKLHRSHWT